MSLAGPENLTRAEGLARLGLALPLLGKSYAARRNFVPGAAEAPTTALLSPWLRHRLVTEEETVRAVLDRHGQDASGKFVQEVFWRTYFKGFLEQHPGIWTSYLQGLARMKEGGHCSDAACQAEAGRTGIACFDDWAGELRETGWLHNHVRMWFASIWIFTLRLPWELGADFFARHLLDFDPASNTLSWRWVAGLHTRGKHYVARAENIARYTGGRYDPAGQLNEAPLPLDPGEPPPRVALPAQADLPESGFALLLHGEDCCPENFAVPPAQIVRVAILEDAARVAMIEDTRRRAQTRLQAECRLIAPCGVADWARGLAVVTPYAPVGPVADALAAAGPVLRRRLRDWDIRYWPWCGKGYFQLKDRIERAARQASRNTDAG